MVLNLKERPYGFGNGPATDMRSLISFIAWSWILLHSGTSFLLLVARFLRQLLQSLLVLSVCITISLHLLLFHVEAIVHLPFLNGELRMINPSFYSTIIYCLQQALFVILCLLKFLFWFKNNYHHSAFNTNRHSNEMCS